MSLADARCPKCKDKTLRVMVDLYLDIPIGLAHQLSKKNVARREVKVMGAGWPTARLYCDACGWISETRGI